MKNICNKITISYSLILIILLSFLSGLFKDILVLYSIIIFHELGHVFTSKIFNWKIDKINFGICGGYISYSDYIDKPFLEEFLISISGFLFQFILMFILTLLLKNNIVNERLYSLYGRYNLSILIFNLIPVLPLDGSKIINIMLNNFFSYRKSLILSNLLSFIFIFLIFIIFLFKDMKIEYSFILILFFLLKKTIDNTHDIPLLFNRFLIEKFLENKKYKKSIYIDSIKNIKRNKNNYIKKGNTYINERYVLREKFDLNYNIC